MTQRTGEASMGCPHFETIPTEDCCICKLRRESPQTDRSDPGLEAWKSALEREQRVRDALGIGRNTPTDDAAVEISAELFALRTVAREAREAERKLEAYWRKTEPTQLEWTMRGLRLALVDLDATVSSSNGDQ